MVKIEQRAFSVSLNQSAIVINDNLVKIYGETAFSYLTATTWAASFKAGESNLMYKIHYGRPIKETIKENIKLVESFISKNPRISNSYFKEQTSLSRETLNQIIKDKLEL